MPDEPVSNEEKDFAKQLALYADAITVFAVVQLLGFVYLLAHGDCFTVNVLHKLWLPVVGSVIANSAYFFLVRSCRRSETALLKSSRGPTVTALANRTWKVRFAIIIAGLVFTVILLFLVAYNIKNNIFSIDCKVKENTCYGFPNVK